MKKQSTIIIISLIMFGFLFSGTCMADDEWNLSDDSGKYHKSRKKHSLDHSIQRKIFLNTLYGITGLTSENLKDALKAESLTSILKKNQCSLTKFKNEIQDNYRKILQNLLTENLISEEQMRKLMERHTRKMERRLTMMTLIENGVENNIITPEQARKLFHFPN